MMFCRYLGQSLGAAIFGAVFNAAILRRLRSAPPALQGRLPHQVNAVGTVLGRPGGLAANAVDSYLRQAISAGTHDVYLGLSGVAVVTLAVIAIVPRRFETTAGAAADVPGE
jgi:hypothetical protein